jgi:prepilin-type N-terminal cleavage/methylation domain-containing protein
MQNRKNFKKGFMLIELLVVVLIIGILAAIALPQYQNAVLKSKMAQSLPILKGISAAQEEYFLINGSYADGFQKLSINAGACTGTYCQINNIRYDIQGDGNIVAFYDSTGSSSDSLSIMYRYGQGQSTTYSGLKNGDFVCIPRGKANWIRLCKSVAGDNYRTVTGFSGGAGYAWR